MIIDQPAAKIDRRRVADQILEDLRGQILSGALPHGAKLPAERELAVHYGVSGPTIREAMRVLTAMGLVDSRNGSGSTVNAQSDTLMSVSISSVMQFEKVGAPDVFGLLAYAVSKMEKSNRKPKATDGSPRHRTEKVRSPVPAGPKRAERE